MMRIPGSDLSSLIDASQDNDVFGLVRLAHDLGVDPDEGGTYLNACDEHMAEIIEGRDLSHRDRVRKLLETRDGVGRPAVPTDGLSARLMAHVCVDPATVLAIATMTSAAATIELGADDERIVFLDDGAMDFNLSRVTLMPEVWWDMRGELCLRHVSETVVRGIIGQPLSMLISHPVLDRHPITVTGTREGVANTVLTTDHVHVPLDLDEIMGIRPDA